MGIELETKENPQKINQTSPQNETIFPPPVTNNFNSPENILQKESNINQNEDQFKSNVQNDINPTNISQNILNSQGALNIKEVADTQILTDSGIELKKKETLNNNGQSSQINNKNSGDNLNNQSSSLQNTNLDDFIKKSQEAQNSQNIQIEQKSQNMESIQNIEPSNINQISQNMIEDQKPEANLDINDNKNIESNPDYLNNFNINENNIIDNNNIPETNNDFSANIFNVDADNYNNMNINDFNINLVENNNNDNNNIFINENVENILPNNDYNITTENYDNYILSSTSDNNNIQYDETLPMQYSPENQEINNININPNINTDFRHLTFGAGDTNFNVETNIYDQNSFNQVQQMKTKPLIEETIQTSAQFTETQDIYNSPMINIENNNENKNQDYFVTNPELTAYMDPNNQIPNDVKNRINSLNYKNSDNLEKKKSNVFDTLKESKTLYLKDNENNNQINENKENKENKSNEVIPEENNENNENQNNNDNNKIFNEEKKEDNEIQQTATGGVNILPTQYLKTTTRDVKVLSKEQLKDINNYYDNDNNDNANINNINNELINNENQEDNNLMNSNNNNLQTENVETFNTEEKIQDKKDKKLDISDVIQDIKETEMPNEPFAQRDYIFNKKGIKVIKIEEDETQFCTDIFSGLFKKILGK